ncbi:MAG: hypothetical protein GF308_13825 [Candidatus Heimdallarchaeota archaeon]|nr:hypothetical protein [Candidatus Heimdallarchaeota archaeon]
MDFICGKCNKPLKKTPQLLIHGCSHCGSKVFKTVPSKGQKNKGDDKHPPPTREERSQSKQYKIIPKMWEEKTGSDGLATINLRKRGVYEVNLESLFRSKESDPIILSGKEGFYRIEILPSSKKK